MDLEKIAPVLEDIVRRALYKQDYPFGTDANGFTTLGKSNKIASSSLANSVEVQISKDTQGNYTLSILMEEYWKWVQSGRLPGKKGVPVDSLIQWIKDRGLQGRDKKTGRFITQRSFAFAIQTTIKKFGIRPSNFLDSVFEEISSSTEIEELLEGASLDDLINTIEGL